MSMEELLELTHTSMSDVISDLMRNNTYHSFDDFMEDLQKIIPSSTLNVNELDTDHFNYVTFGGHHIYYSIFDFVSPTEFLSSDDNEEEEEEEYISE